jgi:hypothetical protein
VRYIETRVSGKRFDHKKDAHDNGWCDVKNEVRAGVVAEVGSKRDNQAGTVDRRALEKEVHDRLPERRSQRAHAQGVAWHNAP